MQMGDFWNFLDETGNDISSWGANLLDDAGGYYDMAMNVMDQGVDASWAKIDEAKAAMSEAFDLSLKVDEALNNMPSGPDKDRLMAAREESKGFFNEYVMPAWEKLSSLLGTTSIDPNMGAFPIVAIGVVIAAMGLTYVAYDYNSTVKGILNDPSLTAAQKANLLSKFGISSIGEAITTMKWPLIIGGLGLLGFMATKYIPKKRNA